LSEGREGSRELLQLVVLELQALEGWSFSQGGREAGELVVGQLQYLGAGRAIRHYMARCQGFRHK
jgi:hypothetical protein